MQPSLVYLKYLPSKRGGKIRFQIYGTNKVLDIPRQIIPACFWLNNSAEGDVYNLNLTKWAGYTEEEIAISMKPKIIIKPKKGDWSWKKYLNSLSFNLDLNKDKGP